MKYLLLVFALLIWSVSVQAGRSGVAFIPATGSASIPVASTSTGAIPANNWTGFTSQAGTIFTASTWGATNTKYVSGGNYRSFVAKTTGQARDIEVATWTRNGNIFLRYNPNRTAVYCTINGDTDVWEIGVVYNLLDGLEFGQNGSYYALANGALSSISGYDGSNTAGQIFICGASGFSLYMKFNGVTFTSVTDWHVAIPGYAAILANTGYGFRDVTVTYLSQQNLNGSNPSVNNLNVSDFGLRAGSTTGTITGGTLNQITLAQSLGVAVGDGIIVATGGESGAGIRGTFGVGGVYPVLNYANITAMNADMSKPNGTIGYLQDTLATYQSFSGTWFLLTDAGAYYTSKIAPRALVATVTAVANGGTLLTLDKSAVVATTNAAVYVNNFTPFNYLTKTTTGPPAPNYMRIYIPSGTFASADTATDAGFTIEIVSKVGWTLIGNGPSNTMIVSPYGTPGANIQATQSNYVNVNNLYLIGNAKNNGFGLYWSANGSLVSVFPRGIFFLSSYSGIAHDFRVTNAFQDAFGTEFSDNPLAYNCTIDMTDGLQIYIQWQIQLADSTGGTVRDCSVTSPYLTGGLEGFRSNGFTFQRITLHNAVVSDNTSGGGFLYEDITVAVDALSQLSAASFAVTNPVFNFNGNIGGNPGIAQGGTVRRFTSVQSGYVNASNDSLTAMIIGDGNPNITIEGTYPASNGQGCIQAPNFAGLNNLLGIGVRSSGNTAVVSGMRFIGHTDYANNIGNIHTEGGSLTSTNNIMDHAVSGSGTITETGTQSNATWNGNNPGKLNCINFLLKRDIAPASNDNSPMWLSVAA